MLNASNDHTWFYFDDEHHLGAHTYAESLLSESNKTDHIKAIGRKSIKRI